MPHFRKPHLSDQQTPSQRMSYPTRTAWSYPTRPDSRVRQDKAY